MPPMVGSEALLVMKLAQMPPKPYGLTVTLLTTPIERIAYRYSNPLCGHCGKETSRNKNFRVEGWFCCNEVCMTQLWIDRAY